MDYNASVYNNELKRMATGEVNLYSGGPLLKLVTLFYEMDEKTIPNKVLYGESLRCLNKLVEYRRLRIFAGNNTVPPAVWIVLLIGGVITVSYTYLFGMKNIKAQYLTTAALTVTITMILVLIYILDHPFTGPNSISMQPLEQAMDVMKRNFKGGS
jgi:hypothetical protein